MKKAYGTKQIHLVKSIVIGIQESLLDGKTFLIGLSSITNLKPRKNLSSACSVTVHFGAQPWKLGVLHVQLYFSQWMYKALILTCIYTIDLRILVIEVKGEAVRDLPSRGQSQK